MGDPHAYMVEAAREHYRRMEQRITFALQPRPWWLPKWLWRKLIARMRTVEISDAGELEIPDAD